MQSISTELENEIQDSSQTVLAKVRAQWADNRVLDNLKVMASSDSWYRASLDTQYDQRTVYWRLNDLSGSTYIQDHSGRGNNGTINGAVTIQAVEKPLTGDNTSASIHVNASTEFISVSAVSACPANFLNATWEFWVRPVVTKAHGFFSDFISSASTNEITVGTDASNQINFSVTGTTVQTASVVSNSVWHYVALTKDGNDWTLYLDGVAVGTLTKDAPEGGFNTIWVGKNQTNFMEGYICEFVGTPATLDEYEVAVRYKQTSSAINNTFFVGRELFNARPEQTFSWCVCNGTDENNQPIRANGKFYAMEDEPSGTYEYGYRSYRTTANAYQTVYGSLATYDELAYAKFDQRLANRINVYLPDTYGPARELGFLKYIEPDGTLVDCSTNNFDLSLGRRKSVFYLSADDEPVDLVGVYVSFHASKYLGDSINIEEIEISYEEDVSDDIVSMTVSKVRDSFDSSVPFGITAANSASLELDNTDRKYNVFNGDSDIAPYIRKDVKFDVSLGWSLGAINDLSITPDLWVNGHCRTWLDTGRTAQATVDGDLVAVWDDASGADHHAVQATSNKRFTLRTLTNGLNGYNTLRADGSNDSLVAPITAGAAKTIFVVGRKVGAIDASNRALFSFDANASLVTRTALGARYGWEFDGVGAAAQVDGHPQNWNISVVRLTSSGFGEFWNNGGLPVEFDPNNGYSSATSFAIASIGDSSAFGDFDFAELICYNQAISDDYINLIGGALADKFLLTWFNLEN